MPQSFDPRDARIPRSRSARSLGPYETAYDVRRGYTEADHASATPMRQEGEEVWRGRGRDER